MTDIYVPGSLDGIGLAWLIWTLRPSLPVIYIAAQPDVLCHMQPLGPREVLLRKSFALSDLLAAARRLLGHFH